VAGVVGFLPKLRWPSGASTGDFLEIVLRRERDLWEHPDRLLFDAPSRRAVRSFFENGGDTVHLFVVCLDSLDDLTSPAACAPVLSSLVDRLRAEEDIGILLVPGAAYLPSKMSRKGTVTCSAETIYSVLLAHCREMNNRFLMIDAPDSLHGLALERWVADFRERNAAHASYGAIYYPWLMDRDERIPPAAVVAGNMARLEIENRPFGVAWPPANRTLRGATHCEVDLSWDEAGALSEQAINPLLVQPGRGMVAFGARTLSTKENDRYINSRRVLNMVVEQLRRDNDWAVFETNNPHLWDVLERDVGFRLAQFSAGGMLLSGPGSNEDYSVRCDRETNLPQLRDAGQVNVEVRLRPVGTVEHIVVDLRIGEDGSAGGI
jgi:phage tail sheath protein FI